MTTLKRVCVAGVVATGTLVLVLALPGLAQAQVPISETSDSAATATLANLSDGSTSEKPSDSSGNLEELRWWRRWHYHYHYTYTYYHYHSYVYYRPVYYVYTPVVYYTPWVYYCLDGKVTSGDGNTAGSPTSDAGRQSDTGVGQLDLQTLATIAGSF